MFERNLAFGSLRPDDELDGFGVKVPQFKPDEDYDDDDKEAEDKDMAEVDADIRDVRYTFECKLSEASRGLAVKPLTIMFTPDSVYGNRLGHHSGIMVTAKGRNHFHKSKLWRTATCSGVEMLFGP
jgi:hypothetical protein